MTNDLPRLHARRDALTDPPASPDAHRVALPSVRTPRTPRTDDTEGKLLFDLEGREQRARRRYAAAQRALSAATTQHVTAVVHQRNREAAASVRAASDELTGKALRARLGPGD